MGKTCRVVICGQLATGKTSLIEQLIYGNHVIGSSMYSTIEDVYVANIDTDRGQKEKVRFYDTAGLDATKPELQKHYMGFADGYILVYDVCNFESFKCMDKLKKDIDKNKEKKEAMIICLGNKCDIKDKKEVEFQTANKWAQKEKVRLWEVSVANRQSLIEPFIWLTSRMTQPPNKSSFPLGMVKKAKSGLSNDA